jgi:hypothetical protein
MPNPAPLAKLVGRPVFSVGADTYAWEDVILFARLSGEWAALEDEVRHGIACAKRHRDLRQHISDADLEAAARDFRYKHRLEGAAEMNAWLQRWHLTPDRWMKAIRRSVLCQRCPLERGAVVERYPAGPDEVVRSLLMIGACSGQFLRFAQLLADRAAVHAKMTEAHQEPRPSHSSSETSQEKPDQAGRALLGSPAARLAECQNRLVGVLQAFERFRQALVTPDAIRRQIGARHADWVHLICDCLTLPTAAAARESALCVRMDGDTLEAVAERCHVPLVQVEFFLDEMEPAQATGFLTAQPGDLVGPLDLADGFRLYRIRAKKLPDEADPIVRQKAADRILGKTIEAEVAKRVKWLEAF